MADYDLGKLREGLVSVDANIKALEDALATERAKRDVYVAHIASAEAKARDGSTQ